MPEMMTEVLSGSINRLGRHGIREKGSRMVTRLNVVFVLLVHVPIMAELLCWKLRFIGQDQNLPWYQSNLSLELLFRPRKLSIRRTS